MHVNKMSSCVAVENLKFPDNNSTGLIGAVIFKQQSQIMQSLSVGKSDIFLPLWQKKRLTMCIIVCHNIPIKANIWSRFAIVH